MGDKTGIQWTNSTWNISTGCTKVTAGCDNCYAEREAERLQRMGVKKYANGFKFMIHPDALFEPLKWKTPRMIFVDSMSDLFHREMSDEMLLGAFAVMKEASWHTFQVLTKRPLRMLNIQQTIFPNGYPPNVWVGTSVEDARVKGRIDLLRKVVATLRFLSCEPLIGPMGTLDLTGIGWVITGGESGPNHRPFDPQWARKIRDQCVAEDVPYFHKQNGGVTPKSGGRSLDGQEWNQIPKT